MPSFSRIDWLSTLKVTFARGLASTIVLGIASFAGFRFLENWQMFIAWPFLAVIGATITYFLVKAVGYVFKSAAGSDAYVIDAIINLMLFAVSLLIACGDPIIYALNQMMPGLLNIVGFKIFNFTPLFIIYVPEEGLKSANV